MMILDSGLLFWGHPVYAQNPNGLLWRTVVFNRGSAGSVSASQGYRWWPIKI